MRAKSIGIITKYIGVSLLLEAMFMLISAGISAYNDFDEGFLPLLYSGLITGIMGFYPSIFVSGGKAITRGQGYYIVLGSWVLCCFMGMIPFVMYGEEFSFTNALFESVSGFTTTGASILSNIEGLPQGLLFWRMSTAWIGGIGIVALFSLVMNSAKGNDSVLSSLEMSSIAKESANMRSHSFVHAMIWTYVTLTAVAIISLKIGGMRWFDAVTHAMSACSTCGFSTKNASIAEYNSPVIEVLLMVFMSLGSINFILLSGFFLKKGRRFIISSSSTKGFILSVVIIAMVIASGLFISGYYDSIIHCLRQASFQAVSIITTTGFATADTNVWPPICASALVLASFVCGCSGSTSGGIKMDRAIIALKSFVMKVKVLHSPNRVISIRMDGKPIGSDRVSDVLNFITCYVAITILGGVLITLTGVDIKTSWTAAVACIGNVGPGLGNVGSFGNYDCLPALAKYISMSLMIIGRLEIFPVLYVILGKWSD